MHADFKGKTVLILEGAGGTGRECGALFLKLGANLLMTHSGSANDTQNVLADFNPEDVSRVNVVPLDLTQSREIKSFINDLGKTVSKIDVLIACFKDSPPFTKEEVLDEQAYINEIHKTGWPFFEIFIGLEKKFQVVPGHSVIVIEERYRMKMGASSVSESIVETLAHYMTTHFLFNHCRINLLRKYSTNSTDGREAGARSFTVSDEDAAKSVVTLCGGLMDAVSGQTIFLDKEYRSIHRPGIC